MTSSAGSRKREILFDDPAVAAVFDKQSGEIRAKLMRLRRLIFGTASATDGVGEIEETLKWGQPAYLTSKSKSGSTIRIGSVKRDGTHYAMYFHCQSNLVATFREIYPVTFRYEGNRAILFRTGDRIDEGALRHCVSLALTYHLRNARHPASRAAHGMARASAPR